MKPLLYGRNIKPNNFSNKVLFFNQTKKSRENLSHTTFRKKQKKKKEVFRDHLYIQVCKSLLPRTYIKEHPLLSMHGFIFSCYSVLSSMIVWKDLRRIYFNHWPECFLKTLLKVTSQVDVVLWSIKRSCHDSSDYLAWSLKFNNNNNNNNNNNLVYMSGYLPNKLIGDTTKTKTEIKCLRS